MTSAIRIIACILGVAVASSAPQQPPEKSFTRSEATAIIANTRKIVTPNGIERLEKVRIAGIDQWVSIRGRDKRNPVLLLIHGGPGYVSIPMGWWFSRDWEEYFTVVQWDQRGTGKTNLLNDPAAIAPTLTLEGMVTDAEEMTRWVRRELGKDRIFAMGHSAGSYPGIELALRHPQWLYAYIGVGQIADFPESERRGWAFAMNAARSAKNPEAVHELENIAPYFAQGHRASLQDIFTERKWVEVYGGVMAYRSDNKADSGLAELSPDYSAEEIAHIWDGDKFTEKYLLQNLLSLNLSPLQKLDCPLIIFAGRHDYNVNSQVAAEWFAKVKAPSKQFVWFEDSGHMPMTEEPGKFLVSLLRYARPVSESADNEPPEGSPVVKHKSRAID